MVIAMTVKLVATNFFQGRLNVGGFFFHVMLRDLNNKRIIIINMLIGTFYVRHHTV